MVSRDKILQTFYDRPDKTVIANHSSRRNVVFASITLTR